MPLSVRIHVPDLSASEYVLDIVLIQDTEWLHMPYLSYCAVTTVPANSTFKKKKVHGKLCAQYVEILAHVWSWWSLAGWPAQYHHICAALTIMLIYHGHFVNELSN